MLLRGNGDTITINVVFTATASIFMWFPTIAAVITRKLTGDRFKVNIRPHIKRNVECYIGACLLPGILILVGAVVFFILFPQTFDLTWSYALSMMGEGAVAPFALTVPIVLLLGMASIVVAPLVFINHIFAFGEEFGWRGYILPKLQSFMSDRKAVLVSGALWGLGHAPLVLFGLNYGAEYPGFPYTGIFMMTVFAAVIGVWLSYLTIQTKSVVAASIAHGAINAIRELPLFVAVSGVDTLLGPKPSGIVGMVGFIVVASVCFHRMKGRQQN